MPFNNLTPRVRDIDDHHRMQARGITMSDEIHLGLTAITTD